MTDFSPLPLPPELQQALEVLEYHQMTPVQAASLPPILAGRDVIAQARTGSGKTAAFGLGLLSKLQPDAGQVQALVMCPTRELADQVGKEIRRLARFMPNIKCRCSAAACRCGRTWPRWCIRRTWWWARRAACRS